MVETAALADSSGKKSQSEPEPKQEPAYASALLHALSYLLVEGIIIVSCSAIFHNVGAPPWRLEGTAPWHVTLTQVSIWMNLCHGLSTLINGAFYREFKQPHYRIAWATCWAVCCVTQCVVSALGEQLVPWPAKIAVVAVANVATVSTHMWPFVAAGRHTALKAVRLHLEDKILWALHGWLLRASSNRFDNIPAGAQLLNILWPQALFQMLAWADALHSAPFQSWGLYMMANHASHALSIHMAWKAQVLGQGHAAVVIYLFFALSSALYTPRASLPNFAAEKTTRIW